MRRTDTPSYMTVHVRLHRERGSAKNHDCYANCGRPALHWAYDHSDLWQKYHPRLGCAYSADLTRYVPMCARCHGKYDAGHLKVPGLTDAFSTLKWSV